MSVYESIYGVSSEDTHIFNVKLAERTGVHKAILLQYLMGWCKSNYQSKQNIFYTVPWVYDSAITLAKKFPYFSQSGQDANRRSINRWLNELQEERLILISRFNKAEYDKTNWYTINPFRYYAYIRQQDEMQQGILWWNDLKNALKKEDESEMGVWTNCPIEWTKSTKPLDKLSNQIGQFVQPIPLYNNIYKIDEITKIVFEFFAQNPDQKKAVLGYANFSETQHGSFDDQVKKYVLKNIANPLFAQDPTKGIVGALANWLLTAKSYARATQSKPAAGTGTQQAGKAATRLGANKFKEETSV